MSGITTVSLGEGMPAFFDTFPLLDQSTWAQVWAVFPFQSPLQHAILTQKLQASPELRAPRRLQADTPPAAVNTFLAAINDAFPRGPATPTTKIGPKTNPRECAAKDGAALQRMFGAQASLYSPFTGVWFTLGNSGRAGGLVLVATGQNIVFANTAAARDLQARIAAAQDPRPLQQEYDNARAAHATGTVDWHDVVVYFINNLCFIYDPSALTINGASATGDLALQQAAAGVAINAGIIANIGTAAHLWRASYGPHGKFGQAANVAGGYIGGGGNYADDGGHCRQMCATFLVVAHALQWLWHRGSSAGLSEAQCEDAGRNLDWLLGGKLTGHGVEEGCGRRGGLGSNEDRMPCFMPLDGAL
jgi:hypothetical protein